MSDYADKNYYIVTEEELTDVADAIRNQLESSEGLTFPNGFITGIGNISGGGGGEDITSDFTFTDCTPVVACKFNLIRGTYVFLLANYEAGMHFAEMSTSVWYLDREFEPYAIMVDDFANINVLNVEDHGAAGISINVGDIALESDTGTSPIENDGVVYAVFKALYVG